jgi:hypothetical protein
MSKNNLAKRACTSNGLVGRLAPARRLVLLIFSIASCVVSLADDSVEIARGKKPNAPQQPQLAIDAKGTIHVVFGQKGAIHYCRSEDGGKTFKPSTTVASPLQIALGMRRGPRITASSDSVCITFIGGNEGKGRDGDVLSIRSVDKGNSWSQPVAINDIHGSGREGLHGMASGPGEMLCCVWLDLRSQQTEVMAATSTDGGSTWGKNNLVYRSPTGSVCECCHPSVCFDSEGSIYVLWRNALRGDRDMYYAKSIDGGAHFGQANKLSLEKWRLDACPMDGGSIAVSNDGEVTTTWRRRDTVFLTTNDRLEEVQLGVGEQPWVACTRDGPYVIWLEKRGGAVRLLKPNSTEPMIIDHHASDPVVSASPDGSGLVVAAWESIDGEENSIRCLVIRN